MKEINLTFVGKPVKKGNSHFVLIPASYINTKRIIPKQNYEFLIRGKLFDPKAIKDPQKKLQTQIHSEKKKGKF